MLDLLNRVIVQDETLSRELASNQTWRGSNGHNASLKDITVELESAKTEVSDLSFMAKKWEKLVQLRCLSSLIELRDSQSHVHRFVLRSNE